MLKIQIPGNKATRRNLRSLPQRDLYGQRLQEQSFKTWRTQTINTWRRSSISYQRSWEIKQERRHFSTEAFKTNVLTWRMFMSSSMKAAIRLWPNYMATLEVYKNMDFEEIQSFFQYHTEIDIGAFWRTAVTKEEINNLKMGRRQYCLQRCQCWSGTEIRYFLLGHRHFPLGGMKLWF